VTPEQAARTAAGQEVDMRSTKIFVLRLIVGVLGAAVASAALAQGNRSAVDIQASPGVPEFRDPKTGQVWTPETVGQDGRPLAGPEDKAFDPTAQNSPAMIGEQRVRGRPVGTASGIAGPTTPIVAVDNPTLRVVPGQRWQVLMYLDNNSANPVNPVLECRFLNGANTVMTTRATVAQTGPRVRQGLVIYGPRADVFVDRTSCSVISP
jgi:hypothetical protein